MMVHGKHTATLKRCLKVPQPDIRYYTLKIIKGQVPYYHRKWRQSNMRVITAIYLYVKPGLRDEWLSQSGEGEGDGESSLAMERAVRSLAFWYNVRRYPDEMGMMQEDVAQNSDLDVGALAGFQSGSGEDVDPNDDDVNLLDLGAPPSPPQELDQQQATPFNSAAPLANPNTFTSPVTTNTNTTQPTTHQPRPRTSSNASTTSTSSRRSSVLSHEPDFFLQELERMDLIKDEKTGFWSAPTPYSPYAEHVRAQQEAQILQVQQKRGNVGGMGMNGMGRQQANAMVGGLGMGMTTSSSGGRESQYGGMASLGDGAGGGGGSGDAVTGGGSAGPSPVVSSASRMSR